MTPEQAHDLAAARMQARAELRGFREAAYPLLCRVQSELHEKPGDTPEVDARLCSLMKAAAPLLLRYRRGTAETRDRLARIALVARLEDLEFMQRLLIFYLNSPPARGWY